MSCTIKRVICLDEPIKFSEICIKLNNNIYTNNSINDQCSFSWSADSINWTCWVSYSDYLRICKSMSSDFYLRVLFSAERVPDIYINKVSIDNYSVIIYNPNPFLNEVCNNNFNIYDGWECAMLMQQQLSDQIICTLGIPIYYFKVDPVASTKDYTFKEYVLHNISDVKIIKMMITDGAMPSSKPILSEWDFDFELDWETELSKTQFARAFGDTAIPKHRDLLYVPMQKRFYEVNSAYEEKNENLMWKAVTWKIALVKYNEKTNIYTDNDNIESLIDEIVVNKYSNIFGQYEEKEQYQTGIEQTDLPKATFSTLYPIEESDYVRKNISIDMEIVQNQINNRSVIIAKHMYKPKQDSLVEYQQYLNSDCGTISLIFDSLEAFYENPLTIMIIGKEKKLYLLRDEICMDDVKLKILPNKTYMIIIRWNVSNMVLDMNLIEYVHPDLPEFKLKPFMYYFDIENMVSTTCIYPKNFKNKYPEKVYMYGYPFNIHSMKLYSIYINNEELGELFKFTTEHESNVINDLVRPINDGRGYFVR